jgi:hypothetical protein
MPGAHDDDDPMSQPKPGRIRAAMSHGGNARLRSRGRRTNMNGRRCACLGPLLALALATSILATAPVSARAQGATSREPYRPVTLEAALHAGVAHASQGDAFRQRAADWLAHADQATLQAPAYDRDDRAGGRRGIVAETGPDAWPLLTINPAYDDPALPPQAPQALAVDLLGMEIDLPASDPRQRRRFARHRLEAADWQAGTAELGR